MRVDDGSSDAEFCCCDCGFSFCDCGHCLPCELFRPAWGEHVGVRRRFDLCCVACGDDHCAVVSDGLHGPLRDALGCCVAFFPERCPDARHDARPCVVEDEDDVFPDPLCDFSDDVPDDSLDRDVVYDGLLPDFGVHVGDCNGAVFRRVLDHGLTDDGLPLAFDEPPPHALAACGFSLRVSLEFSVGPACRFSVGFCLGGGDAECLCRVIWVLFERGSELERAMALPFGVVDASRDALIGFSNVTAAVRGTLAFATLFFGPLASNHVVDQAGFDALAAEFDGELPALSAFFGETSLSFHRRSENATFYDGGRNLTRAGLRAPRDHDCGGEFVECVPGPCGVWEYDYQFAGLQLSQEGSVQDHAVYNASRNLSFFPMVGTVRCGPLFGVQYVNNVDARTGEPFDPATATKRDEFNILGELTPATLVQGTLDYLPVELGADLDVYPVHGENVVPVPHGVNLNPRWYYDGYASCFPVETSACDEATLLMNWLYNMNPAALDCRTMVEPPPYAPAGPSTPDDATAPWAPANATFDGPSMEEDPRFAAFTGNPRLQRMELRDSTGALIGGRAGLVGYSRGAEDGYIEGLSNNLSGSYILRDGTTDSVRHGVKVHLGGLHWPNGRGPNHRITPQEAPSGVYTPTTCDFTQCRWVPRAPNQYSHHVVHALKDRRGHAVREREVRKNKQPNYAESPSAAFAVAASELAVPSPDPLTIRDGPSGAVNCSVSPGTGTCSKKGNSAFQQYSRGRAWLNRIRAYGYQHLQFLKDLNQSWRPVPALVEYYGRNFFISGAVNASLACAASCAEDVNGSCPSPFVGLPCSLDYRCNDTAFTAAYGACDVVNGTERQPVCCSEYAPFALDPSGGQRGGASTGFAEDCVGGAVFDVEAGTGLGCQNFYARQEVHEIFTAYASDDTGPGGRCRYNNIAYSLLADPPNPTFEFDHMMGDRTLPCYGSLGSEMFNGQKNRQRVIKQSDENINDPSKHSLQWSRATSIDGAGLSKYSTEHKFEPPGYTGMTCVDDKQAFFYELGTRMDYEYSKSNRNRLGNVKFSYRHNLIPTMMSLSGNGATGNAMYNDGETSPTYGYVRRLFSADAVAVDDPDVWGSECSIRTFNGVQGSKETQVDDNGINVNPGLLPNPGGGSSDPVQNTDGHDCGVLTMMTQHVPQREPGSKFRPLRAYYQETREAEQASPVRRLASFPNSNTLQGSFACDCRSSPIVWRWLDVFGAPPSLSVVASYRSAVLVMRSFAWKSQPVHTSPLVGLFLPSGRPVFKLAERDVLINGTADDAIHERLAGPDAPGRDALSRMIFDGPRYDSGRDEFAAFPPQVFKYGSCLRWPYGQVPRLGLTPDSLARLYPNVSKQLYGVEAMMGYCERLTGTASGKLQACVHDPLSPVERHRFCQAHAVVAEHVVYGYAVSAHRRDLDAVCSSVEHKTCLVVPGGHALGSLRSVLQEHHRRYRHDPDQGSNWTFLVTPFNATVMDLLLANRTLSVVAQGVDFEDDPAHVAVADSDGNVTGLAADPEVFAMFDDNDHSSEAIVDAMTRFARVLQNSTAGCPRGEYRVPARSETLFSATECVRFSELFPGSPEAGGAIRFPGTTVVSAVAGMPLRFSAVRHDFKNCARLTVRAAGAFIGDVVVNQTGCESPATAFVIRDDGRDLSLANVTIVGPSVASGVTVETQAGTFTDVDGMTVGVTFAGPPAVPFRTHFAASGAVGTAALLYNGTAVLLPRPGGVLNFTESGRVDDLSSTLAEFAHGPMRRLYSTNAVGNTEWVVTVTISITLGVIFLLVLTYIIIRNSRGKP